MSEVEYRCPRDRRTMFGKLFRVSVPFDEPPVTVTPAYLEFACAECRRALSKRGLQVRRVLHRYAVDGDGSFIETRHEASL